MKTRKYNWMIKVPYITEENHYIVKHIYVFDSTKEEVLRYSKSLDNCSSICIYKLETVL